MAPRGALGAGGAAAAAAALVALAAAALPMAAAAAAAGTRPIIGIFTQPTSRDDPTPMLAASYVKFVEMAGGRAAPFFHNSTREQLRETFSAVNGVLFPGGSSSVTRGAPLREAAEFVYDLAVAENAAGGVFPVHGTCLGFEMLSLIVARTDDGVLSDFDAEDCASELTPHKGDTHVWQASKLYGLASPTLLARAADASLPPLAMENHRSGVSPDTFAKVPGLRENFTLLTTSLDRVGKRYVSSVEHKSMPITATQWHPEKAAFEWTTEQHIPHSAEAVALTQAIANYLVAQARLSSHRPKDIKAERALIMANYEPTFTAVYEEKRLEVARQTARKLGRPGALVAAGEPGENDENLFDQIYFFPS